MTMVIEASFLQKVVYFYQRKQASIARAANQLVFKLDFYSDTANGTEDACDGGNPKYLYRSYVNAEL